jgi:ATP-dependent DNA helicase RecG
MPDYDLCSVASVRLTLHGRLFDPKYSRLLIQNPDLSLSDIIALDRVQKKLPIFDEAIRRLRRARLIEGRKPNFHISLVVAKATAQKEEYIRTRAQDDVFYSKLIKDYLDKFGTASRKEIDNLLWKKLSDVLDDEQKTRKVGNLLTNMRRAGIIRNTGSRRAPKWELV